MDLSVIIVNYNVRYFLEQCLHSVFDAGQGLEMEVWVVDNASVDGSVEMVKDKFPQVKLIANQDNPGFAKANNQALRQATGKYLLLLNPDTLVEKETFHQCVDFMEAHPDCGGLGVKMINGDGKFLKESKRGFPTPETSFYKISGLIKLFPHHKTIAHYYMGDLSDDETNEIEILPGAYLMISHEALDKVGLLDESYFMYGEDIDFSWRIKLAGYKNYYLPSARIIHYKGECTKKGSMNYVYTFYNAMVIFAKKYFSGRNASLYIGLIQMAIWMRASLAWLKRIGQKIAVPLLDFFVAWGGMVVIKQLWATYLANNVGYYPAIYTWVILPIYVLIMMICSWLYGGYDKPVKLSRITKGVTIGALTLLIFYSLLDETQRYSRAVLLLGSAWTLISILGIRGILSLCGIEGYKLKERKCKGCLIVGSKSEFERINSLYNELGIEVEEVVHVPIDEMDRLNEMIRIYKADEVIFCSHDLSPQAIINEMLKLKSMGAKYKIAPAEGDFVIGSNIINSREDLYTIELNPIVTPMSKRNKRLLDIFVALLLIIFSPILFWGQKRKKHYFGDCFKVLFGKLSWVGVSKSVFKPSDILPGRKLDEDRMNIRYTRNYKVTTDITIIWRNLLNI